MSLVERALDKLRRPQAGERGNTGTYPASIGSMVEHDPATQNQRRIVIDRGALRAAGYLPEETQDRRFADEYRQIKRPVVLEAFAPEAATREPSRRLVMMASSLPGDGKTFTSINLALSLAREKDSSVCLVDGDVAKPHISRIFGVDQERGLLDALAEPGLDVASLILPTDVRGLSILPAGRVRDGATELLASARMSELTRQILARNPRSLALFDSPPLAISSESRVLAAAVGQVLLVVRAGHTPRQALVSALGELGPGQSVKLVLNQGRRGLLQGYYGHSYGTYGDNNNQ